MIKDECVKKFFKALQQCRIFLLNNGVPAIVSGNAPVGDVGYVFWDRVALRYTTKTR